jgi:MSHA pilin protein MshA
MISVRLRYEIPEVQHKHYGKAGIVKKEQRGFTLIELVMVIVILGVLAAVALPKFVDLSSDAKTAAITGAAGALSSYSAINYAAYQANSTNTANAVRLSASGAGALLVASMGTWDAKFAVGTDATCGTTVGASKTVGLSYVGGTATATATIICTG